MESGCCCLPGHGGSIFLHQFRVKAAALGQRNGKYGLIAVNHIRHKEQGNGKAGIFQVISLELFQISRAGFAQDGACALQLPVGEMPLSRGTGEVGRGQMVEHVGYQLCHLHCFFFQGHFRYKFEKFGFFHGVPPFTEKVLWVFFVSYSISLFPPVGKTNDFTYYRGMHKK